MSLDYSFSFGENSTTFSFEDALNDTSFVMGSNRSMGHSRSSSHASASMYSQESSPEPLNTGMTTPARSPIRQHGPLLLPKIRPQDQEIHASPPPPKRFKRAPTHTSTTTFKPQHTRSYTNPESVSFMPQVQDNFPSHTRSMSTLCSPVPFAPSHERRSSSVSLDGQTLEKYGFPTYRQMPSYIPSATNLQTDNYIPQSFYQTHTPQRTPSPLQNSLCAEEITMSPIDDGNNTSLSAYLTSPNPAPALVRQINIHIRDSSAKHFWWDIRQIRPWTSFNPTTINNIPGLSALLNINLPTSTFPIPARTSSTPETESDLQNIYTSFYGTKLNAALSLSLGQRHLMMRASKNTTDPSFISNYTDDTSALIYGRGLGRVVGLVKSFDRWNTGMRVEGNHRKVEYLRGLSHLHQHMRSHGCRYGFIITEIELVVVRNGSDSTPHFGYLEIQTIQLNTHDSTPSTTLFSESSSSFEDSFSDSEDSTPTPKPLKMTALMALWYLHMLARDDTLPGQVGWKSEIGAPAEGTRRKTLPKDEWIPEPQLAEKREAKRSRGWVWPEESVGRKELGKRGVRYSC
ncbi:hypothetical protein HYFRA_00010278 [Hymenoscyphus fraxineus]|uniref:Sialidase n=1 Tax=Hymenoscyphus fraxineus TaxID=746836 RepID=A0A9N9PJ62_9HELO|nr:hypothetical protein HYFRA_00010278 [Hymenoscyphus fraxineus]